MIKQHKPEKERKEEKMSQYHVYQTEASYVFTGWDRAKKSFSLADYKKVYMESWQTVFLTMEKKSESTSLTGMCWKTCL